MRAADRLVRSGVRAAVAAGLRGVPGATASLLALTLAHGIAVAAEPAAVSGGLEEIVVTAQRREQSLQSVPVAVSAFSADAIESRQIQSTIDLVRMIPNLVGHGNTGVSTANTYFLRGLGSTEQIALLDPSVSTYVDDIIIPRQNANNYAMFEVERLEVLRGPQGTTFGRNSTGGAINVITRKPGTEFKGAVSAGYGSFGRVSGRASVDVPFSPTVLTKFAAFYMADDGWLTNDYNGEKLNGMKNYGARAALRLLPTDAVTVDLTAEYIEADGIYLRSLFGNRDHTRTVFTKSGATGDVLADTLNRRGLRNETDTSALSAIINWKLSDTLSVTSLTGWRTTGQEFVLDFGDPNRGPRPPAPQIPYDVVPGGAPNPVALNNDGKYTNWSQEFKLNGSFGDNLKYVAGVYVFYENNTTKAGQNVGTSLTAYPYLAGLNCSSAILADATIGGGVCPTAANPLARGYGNFRDMRNKTTSYAAYAQTDWTFAPDWTLVTGLRFTDETKKVDLRRTADQAGNSGITTADLVRVGIPTKLSGSQVTPKVGVNWQVAPDFLAFVSATNGYKAGGWNSRSAFVPQAFTPMEPEKTWSYEIGFKSEFFDRRVRLNANAFLAKTKNLQLSYTTPVPNTTPGAPPVALSIQANAGDVKVKGFEFEFATRLSEYVDAYTTVGLQRGEYTSVNRSAQSFCTNGGSIQASGLCGGVTAPLTTAYTNAIDPTDTPSRLPRRSIAGGFNVNLPAGNVGKFRFTLEANYDSGYWTTASNADPDLALVPGALLTPNVKPSYAKEFTLFNASLGWESTNGMWRAGVDCKNCFDKVYTTAVFNGLFYGDPRRYNATVTVKF
jgi:iron complex outermembrane receptor protein